MIVAGIDPSLTSAGVAILHNGQIAHLSHHGHKGTDHANDTRRSRRIRHQAKLIRTAATTCGQPDFIVIERPLLLQQNTAFDRYLLAWALFGNFDALSIPVMLMNNQTAKVWITGQGKASKADIVAAVQSWWPNATFANDDEADAAGLAAIGAFHLGEPMPFTPKDRHTTGLAKVTWPEEAHP